MPQLLVTINDQAMLPRVRMAIKTLKGVDAVVKARTADTPAASRTAAKAKAEANMKEALGELKRYKKGELQFQSAESFANDFRMALTQLMETIDGKRKTRPVEELIDELRSTDN